jgi:hypothetical protein
MAIHLQPGESAAADVAEAPTLPTRSESKHADDLPGEGVGLSSEGFPWSAGLERIAFSHGMKWT